MFEKRQHVFCWSAGAGSRRLGTGAGSRTIAQPPLARFPETRRLERHCGGGRTGHPPAGAPNNGKGQRTWELPGGQRVVLAGSTTYTLTVTHSSTNKCDFKIARPIPTRQLRLDLPSRVVDRRHPFRGIALFNGIELRLQQHDLAGRASHPGQRRGNRAEGRAGLVLVHSGGRDHLRARRAHGGVGGVQPGGGGDGHAEGDLDTLPRNSSTLWQRGRHEPAGRAGVAWGLNGRLELHECLAALPAESGFCGAQVRRLCYVDGQVEGRLRDAFAEKSHG